MTLISKTNKQQVNGNYPYQDIYNGTTQDQDADGNAITQDQLADNLSEQISGIDGNNNDADQYSS